MKTFKILFTLLFFALGTALIAQNADEKQNEKADKKITIIKKTIDEDGNEVIEKIVKEGDDADSMIWIDKDGNEMNFSNDFEFEFKELGEGLKILGDDLENLDILKLDLKNLEGLDEEIQEKMKNMNVEIKELGDKKAVWIYGNEDGESFNFEYNFDDLPVEIEKELKEKGIHLKQFSGENGHSFDYKMGHDNKAFLGVKIGSTVTVENINGEETETVEGTNKNGAEILGTIEGSAAEKAGLLKGDVITSVDGKATKGHEELVEILGEYKVGDEIKIAYLRDGKSLETQATLTGNENAGKVNIWIDQDEEEHHFGEGNAFFYELGEDNDKVKKSTNIIIIRKSNGDGSYEVEIEEESDDRNEDVQFTESQELDLEMVNIFPNPTNGLIQVRFRGEAVPTEIRVNDISGKEIYKERLNNFDGNYNTQVDVSKAAKGTLMLSIVQGKRTFTEKIILE